MTFLVMCCQVERNQYQCLRVIIVSLGVMMVAIGVLSNFEVGLLAFQEHMQLQYVFSLRPDDWDIALLNHRL